MNFTKALTGVLTLCLMFGFVSLICAEDVVKVKAPNPLKALAKVAKAVKKETLRSSFSMDVNVQGGVSFDAEHSISQITVQKEYAAQVNRGFMQVTSIDAFRNGKNNTGAIKDDTIWRNTLATTEGKLFQRLTNFPHVLLQSALDNPKKVEWIWVGDEMDEEDVEVDEEEESEGHTTVVKRTSENTIKRGQPHLLRVTMNPKVALEHFTETINSDCASGG